MKKIILMAAAVSIMFLAFFLAQTAVIRKGFADARIYLHFGEWLKDKVLMHDGY